MGDGIRSNGVVRGPLLKGEVMRALIAVLLTLLFATALPAQEKPKTDIPEQAADKVLAAFKAKDEKALKALAEKDDPDPWLVADELCSRGEHDAAEAFAKAAPRKDVEKLLAYVASHRRKPDNAAARKALATAVRALAAKDPKAALSALGGVDTTAGDVVSARVLHARGTALRSLRRGQDSVQAYAAAAAVAERLGWLRRAAAALDGSGMSAYYRSDWQGALAAWERSLAIEGSRQNRVGVARVLGNIGLVHKRLGAYAKALECQERSLKLKEELGDRAGVARTLRNIGLIHQDVGAYAQALD